MRKLLFLDVETSGLDEKDGEGLTLMAHEVHSIIELAGIVDVDGQIIDRFKLRSTIKHNDTPSKESLQIGNVTMEEILQRPSQRELYEGFAIKLSDHVDKYDKEDKFWVVGFNVEYDMKFLRQLFLDHEDKYFGSWFWTPAIDVMSLAGAWILDANMRAKMKNFKLSTVAQMADIATTESNFHDPMYDCRITRQLFYKIMEE